MNLKPLEILSLIAMAIIGLLVLRGLYHEPPDEPPFRPVQPNPQPQPRPQPHP